MAHVYAARAVLPGMLARGEGYLLNTASAAGLLTNIGNAPYSVTKHAAVGLAEWLAITHGDQGIKVSCLCPQGVRTNMLLGRRRTTPPAPSCWRRARSSPRTSPRRWCRGCAAESFLILPHPEVLTYFQRKAGDHDRWLGGMRKLQRRITRRAVVTTRAEPTPGRARRERPARGRAAAGRPGAVPPRRGRVVEGGARRAPRARRLDRRARRARRRPGHPVDRLAGAHHRARAAVPSWEPVADAPSGRAARHLVTGSIRAASVRVAVTMRTWERRREVERSAMATNGARPRRRRDRRARRTTPGVLAALEQDVGWDPAYGRVIVGSSAGSVTGAALRLGVAASDLAARADGRPAVPRRARPSSTPSTAPTRPCPSPSPGDLAPRLAPAVARAADPDDPPAVGAPGRPPSPARCCPPGRYDLRERTEVLDQLGSGWPTGLWICAARRDDGRRVVFGRAGSPFARPVRGGRRVVRHPQLLRPGADRVPTSTSTAACTPPPTPTSSSTPASTS